MSVKEQLTPSLFRDKLQQGYSVEEIVKGICSRSRGYQILYEYQKKYPDWFPKRKKLDPKEVKDILENHTLTDTARYFGISVNTLKAWMKKWGLEKPTLKERLTPAILQQLIESYSDQQIANIYRCSIHTVRKLRYEYGLHRRNKRKEGKL